MLNLNTRKLHDQGQRLWLDNISHELLGSGTLARYIDEFSVTGLTSNPTIFEYAIGSGSFYNDTIQTLASCQTLDVPRKFGDRESAYS
jgi:transaldolase